MIILYAFLFYSGTPLLPSAFDHFNTPQLPLVSENAPQKNGRLTSDKSESDHTKSIRHNRNSTDADHIVNGNIAASKENTRLKNSSSVNDDTNGTQSSRFTRSAQVSSGIGAKGLSVLHRGHASRTRLFNNKKQLLIKKALELKSKCIRGRQARFNARTCRARKAHKSEGVITRSTDSTPENVSPQSRLEGTDEKEGASVGSWRNVPTPLRRLNSDYESPLRRANGNSVSPVNRLNRKNEVRLRNSDHSSDRSDTERSRSRVLNGSSDTPQNVSESRFRPALRRSGKHEMSSKSDKKLSSPVRSAVAVAAMKRSRLAKLGANRPKPQLSRLLLR